MTLLREAKAANPLIGWQLDPDSIMHVGRELQRPESILAEKNGDLWAADARGGVMHIRPDRTQALISQAPDPHFDLGTDAAKSLLSGTLPNGLAFAANGDFLIANFGTDRLEIMNRRGETRVLLDELDGMPIGKANFVARDSKERLWLSVSTRKPDWSSELCLRSGDGYIILIDDRGARIVADGFHFTNEIRLDKDEQWIYVAETTAKRVSRLRVGADGSLSGREIFGPSSLGDGLIDGITFDAFGNLWGSMIFADRVIVITPDGDVLTILEDGDPEATRRFEDAFATGDPVPFEILMETGGSICPWLASTTFGGADLQTLYLGGVRASTIPFFRVPMAGLPMVHW